MMDMRIRGDDADIMDNTRTDVRYKMSMGTTSCCSTCARDHTKYREDQPFRQQVIAIYGWWRSTTRGQ